MGVYVGPHPEYGAMELVARPILADIVWGDSFLVWGADFSQRDFELTCIAAFQKTAGVLSFCLLGVSCLMWLVEGVVKAHGVSPLAGVVLFLAYCAMTVQAVFIRHFETLVKEEGLKYAGTRSTDVCLGNGGRVPVDVLCVQSAPAVASGYAMGRAEVAGMD